MAGTDQDTIVLSCGPTPLLGKTIAKIPRPSRLILCRWKSLFTGGFQTKAGWIDDVTEYESEMMKDYCMISAVPR